MDLQTDLLNKDFLRKLKRAGLSPQLLTNFYRATIESILCLSAAVWYGQLHCTRLKGLSLGGERQHRGLWEVLFQTWTQYTLAGSRRRPDILPPTTWEMDCLYRFQKHKDNNYQTTSGTAFSPELYNAFPPIENLRHALDCT
ncbi:hypothetical protein L3Q82_010198 [Scortum barcoo]|uniref:Uncharacterized protein n=1 Tax=Scortum barcoo TaxID=214431 RepID=A0ACB8WB67_9TELE|nr:hypothetical protein L3Q82_010198 [Scortum barcoo]